VTDRALTSRYTDPGAGAALLEGLPADLEGICKVAGGLTIHHNLRPHFGIPRSEWDGMTRLWPPRLEDVLLALGPGGLESEPPPARRIVGGCVLESHVLAGLLRFRGYDARVRAGYFRDIRGDSTHVLQFWEDVARARGVEPSTEWTIRQNEIDHRIEHWVCEVRDEAGGEWALVDANTTFLRAHSRLDVGCRLPREHWLYAWEAWQEMRLEGDAFEPDRYYEEPRDGRSHIRMQFLCDFFSLLNHDVAQGDLVKGRSYAESSEAERAELDALAELMSHEPERAELVTFYRGSTTLRMPEAERDPYSFVP
jgi:hypothetical protein